MHDNYRTTDNTTKTFNSTEKSQGRADKKWKHDMFDEINQRPKSTRELVNRYGKDIRVEDGSTGEEIMDLRNRKENLNRNEKPIQKKSQFRSGDDSHRFNSRVQKPAYRRRTSVERSWDGSNSDDGEEIVDRNKNYRKMGIFILKYNCCEAFKILTYFLVLIQF